MLLNEFASDPPAATLGLLTLFYGQPLPVMLVARWADFDLEAKLWLLPTGDLPLTAPVVKLLRRYRSTCGGDPTSYLFALPSGRGLSEAVANKRVENLTGEWFPLDTLCAWALKCVPDLMTGGEWVEKRLSEYVAKGATVTQVEALRREFAARMRAQVEYWHDTLNLDELIAPLC
ncbi:hypothetical protein [Pseudomonas sp. Pse1]|uniref:hypothetical protein n=1 Tax=Pseudomonas sp. Pse1 TaxID=2926020 RepID=UPI00211796EC|nr:hypothetical protein [Pseudomonas sp. Pse1]